MKTILIVLDSVGIGQAPDASDYGDVGAATLQHTAQAVGGLHLPVLQSLGLGNIAEESGSGSIAGVTPVKAPTAGWGRMQEISQGKDTITGHWEIAGLDLRPGFHLFPDQIPTFPEQLTTPFIQQTGRPLLGNCHGSGTAMIETWGEQAMKEGAFIAYTSADSVFQIAAHVDVVPLSELYAACEMARILCDPLRVGRVIARPFTGAPGSFTRTKDRKDFAFKADEPTILEHLHAAGTPVYAIGKIEDIFAQRGITQSWHTGGNPESMAATVDIVSQMDSGFVFANFIDYDMLFGHRRDPQGYGQCLEETDVWLKEFLPLLNEEDTLIITADHGNDPTYTGTDHTREYVPLLVYQPGTPGKPLGLRHGFYDIAQSIAHRHGLAPMPRGRSFL